MRRFFGKKSTGRAGALDAQMDEEGSTSVAHATLELSHVGPYEILAQVGSGGMGTVYKAIDRQRDVTVAIKVLDRRYDLDRKRRKRDYLGREITFVSSINHENIIKMHDQIIEQEDAEGNIRRCLVMEFIDGPNLRYYIQHRVLTVQQMIDICIRLAQGLDCLHQRGIVHRDIKPENFLFSRDLRQVKIVDFGLSKSTTSWRMRWMKEGGGTRRYMSPEQLAKKSLDTRSDIFSFGLVMYELFTGRHPCPGPDINKIMQQIRSSRHRFEPPSKVNPELPPMLDRIILKALRRKPEQRYQSMTEMLLDLTRIAESRI